MKHGCTIIYVLYRARRDDLLHASVACVYLLLILFFFFSASAVATGVLLEGERRWVAGRLSTRGKMPHGTPEARRGEDRAGPGPVSVKKKLSKT